MLWAIRSAGQWSCLFAKVSSVLDCLLDGFEDLAVVWEVEWLKDKREGSIVTADSLNRRLKVVESFLLDRGCQLGTESASDRSFVSHDAPSSFLN